MVIRIPRGAMSDERIARFLDLLVLEQVREKSELTEDDAHALSGEIKRAPGRGCGLISRKPELGSPRDRLDLSGEFFDPLPEDEIDRWKQ